MPEDAQPTDLSQRPECRAATTCLVVAHQAPLVAAGIASLLTAGPWNVVLQGSECRGGRTRCHRSILLGDCHHLSQARGKAGGHANTLALLDHGGETERAACGADASISLRSSPQKLLETVRHLVAGTADRPAADTAARGGLSVDARQRVAEHIQRHLGGRIDVQQLARIAGLSCWHFARAFKLSFGMPPRSYVMRQRVLAAAALMRSSDQTLSDVALAVGFADQSHLTRTFVKTVGETPRRYRKRFR